MYFVTTDFVQTWNFSIIKSLSGILAQVHNEETYAAASVAVIHS